MQKHRHQEYIRFLNAVEATVPASKHVHAIVDNYAPLNIRRCANGWPWRILSPRHLGRFKAK
jgi:hypothetical protein